MRILRASVNWLMFICMVIIAPLAIVPLMLWITFQDKAIMEPDMMTGKKWLLPWR